ncbi:4Fe-4S binding domain protein [Rubripirellula amarantea]|uniref:4Fe-4S binding domain protein n=1 Tax=Rubripirellula amarantea TaxID=2527999 RepID=A0A5C5WTP4_9BACT|nr:ferredoxin family protein [Rubripirellula amarantea]TWT53549.1 4Fe-4S binding domain protein [Rubripirellula amarantea]
MITTATQDTTSKTITVVVSRGQSRNPEKRGLEQAVVELAGKVEGVDVIVIPHLYDLPKSSESFAKLKDIEGDLVVVSWIFSRAAHWVLDRNGICGKVGKTQWTDEDKADDDSGESVASEAPSIEAEPTEVVDRVTDLYPRSDRQVYCLDLKAQNDPKVFVSELRRIMGLKEPSSDTVHLPIVGGQVVQVEEKTGRRWYPVIDFDRCTNCMECIDFCLFGVYGVDHGENILVEQPDNCRKGCPACSRVCPENAIIFPQHKAPAIAGAEVDGDEGFKIDLSQLFGAPTGSDDPIATAARERDEQLLLAGRDAVGIDDQLKKRQSDLAAGPKDRLDNLIDSLEAFDI